MLKCTVRCIAGEVRLAMHTIEECMRGGTVANHRGNNSDQYLRCACR